jgi:trehalose 6-phosphate phosphatase
LDPREAGKLERFLKSLKFAQAPVLLLDYDGTLADFRIDRFTARPWSGVRELLNAIQKDRLTRLIVITGRPAGEINPLLQLDVPVEVWGLHGAERLHVDGRREMEEAPPEALAKLDELRELLRGDAFGGLFEDKSNAVVMHWRGRSPRRAKVIEQRTRTLFEPAAHAPGLSLLPFESGIELRVGRDKGGAVHAIAESIETDTSIVYLGDDLTDESAFCAVNRLRNPHLSVLVRRAWRPTAAEVWLQPPEDLRWFLRGWMRAAGVIGTAEQKTSSFDTHPAKDPSAPAGFSSSAREDYV